MAEESVILNELPEGTEISEGNATDENSGGEAGKETSQSNLESYADFTLPEGMELDEKALEGAAPLFKEIGATQEQAQKLIDIAAGMVQAGAQKQAESFSQIVEDWRKQSEQDSEFGGDKLEENVRLAQEALNKFGTPELKQLMTDYGIGNNPEVIRFMVKIGKLTKEDQPGSASGAATPTKDRLSILYPTSE